MKKVTSIKEILTDIVLRDPDFQKVQTIYNFFYDNQIIPIMITE